MSFSGTPDELRLQVRDSRIACVSAVFPPKYALHAIEMVTAAENGLFERIAYPAEQARYPDGRKRMANYPTLDEFNQLEFLRRLKTNTEVRFTPVPSDEGNLIYGLGTKYKFQDKHVLEKRRPPYRAMVYVGDAEPVHWSKKRLETEGKLSKFSLEQFQKDYERWGFELYLDPTEKRVKWRPSKSHDPAAYQAHLDRERARFNPYSEPSAH